MKKISLKVSKTFPCTHPRKGELTNFREKILSGEKIHTIRSNYDYWKKKIDMVNSGEAVLVLEQWVDRPYWSKVEDFMLFNSESGIGVQKIKIVDHGNFWFIKIFDDDGTPKVQSDCIDHSDCKHDIELYKKLFTNDGLSCYDFANWFKKCDLSEPMAIIHFTGFRY